MLTTFDVETDNSNYDHLVKVLLVGNAGVGKSSLLHRFCGDSCTSNYLATIGVDFKIRSKEVDGKLCKFQIWDTAGQDRFQTIIQSYFKGAHVILICYDVTKKKSLESCSEWFSKVLKLAHEDSICYLVGNKQDAQESEWEVTELQCDKVAEGFSTMNFLCSAKAGYGIEKIFSTIARDYMKDPDKFSFSKNVDPDEKEKPKNGRSNR